MEIDLLRSGRSVFRIPQWRLHRSVHPFDYLACVSRWTQRNRFELYPTQLRQRLPRIRIPLEKSDADVILDIQAALEQVYWDGRYSRAVRYDETYWPKLKAADQDWANQCWASFKSAHPELSPTAPPPNP